MSYLVYFIGIIGTSMVVFRGNLELFISLSLNNGDIIKFTTEKRNKTRLVDGKWQKSLEEFEEWIKTNGER